MAGHPGGTWWLELTGVKGAITTDASLRLSGKLAPVVSLVPDEAFGLSLRQD